MWLTRSLHNQSLQTLISDVSPGWYQPGLSRLNLAKADTGRVVGGRINPERTGTGGEWMISHETGWRPRISNWGPKLHLLSHPDIAGPNEFVRGGGGNGTPNYKYERHREASQLRCSAELVLLYTRPSAEISLWVLSIAALRDERSGDF